MLHAPGLEKKPVSVPALTSQGVLVQFKRDEAVLRSNEVTVEVIK